MVAFRKDILKVGKYHTAGGPVEFTRDDLVAFRDNFRAMKSAGLHVPVIFEHAMPGSADGAPQSARDKAAERVKHGAGWIDQMDVTKDGRLVAQLSATPDAAKKLSDGSVRFVSPEIRRNWSDGSGNEWSNVVSHVALTHHPRNTDQTEFVALSCFQLSMDDLEEEKDKSSEEANPDLPKDVETDQEFDALLAQLAATGLPLASNTTPETLVHDLLIALKVSADAKAKSDADKEEKSDEGGEDDKVVEQQPGVSMSMDSPVMKEIHKGLKKTTDDRIDYLIKAGRITPAMRKELRKYGESIQLSATGDITPTLTVCQVLDMLENGTVDGIALSAEVTDGTRQLSAEDHHNPNWYDAVDSKGGVDVPKDQADKMVDGFLSRTGGKRK